MFPQIHQKDTFSNIRFNQIQLEKEKNSKFKSGKKIYSKKRQRDFNIGEMRQGKANESDEQVLEESPGKGKPDAQAPPEGTHFQVLLEEQVQFDFEPALQPERRSQVRGKGKAQRSLHCRTQKQFVRRGLVNLRLPRSYKNRELVPLAPNLDRHCEKQNFPNSKRKYKQKYLIEKVVRNQGMARANLRDKRKLNRYSKNK